MVSPPDTGRPDAPYCLTDLECDVWRAIVSSMPQNYFSPSHYPLLIQLCRHVVGSNRIAMLVEQCCEKRQIDRAELADLMQMQGGESSHIIRLCRQLRLSPQAIYRGESVKVRPSPVLNVPWIRK